MNRKVLLLSAAVMLVGASAAFAFPPIDMTVAGADYTSLIDGTIWRNLKGSDGDAIKPAGTGVWDPFLRMQANGNGNGDHGVEWGINTDGTVSEPYDNVGNDHHTHSVLFGDLATVRVDGRDYYAFSLDLNEPSGGGQNFVTLGELRIYGVDGVAGGSLVTEAAVQAAAGSTLHYNLDAAGDQTVWLDYNNSNTIKDNGSGTADMTLFIPASFFASVQSTDYMYFLAAMGCETVHGQNWAAQDGFEEWRVLTGPGQPPQAPEPGTVALLGMGLVGLVIARRRK